MGRYPNLREVVWVQEEPRNMGARAHMFPRLMQIMPATARELGINPLVPSQAVDGAARLLRQHLNEFGSLPLALAAYNAGGGAVRRYDGIPPYAETQAYVVKVQNALRALGKDAS